MTKSALLSVLFTILFSCTNQNKQIEETHGAVNSEQTIYHGGEIVTMEGVAGATVEAVVAENDRIIYTGTLQEAKEQYQTAHMHDLKGKTMFPGLIEQHLHPFLAALTLVMNVIAPEPWELPGKTWEGVSTPEDYITTLSTIEKGMTDPNEILMTWGYHHNFHGKISREILDQISATRPILVWHRSCHEFYFNTAMMEKLGLDDTWLNQFSDAVKAQIDLKNGHFYEAGVIIALLPKIFPIIGTDERMEKGLTQMVEILHNNGVTAYNEPGTFILPSHLPIYNAILGADATPMYSFFTPGSKRPFFEHKKEGATAVLNAVEKMTAIFPDTGKVRFFKKQVKLLLDGAIVSQLMMMQDGYLDGHHGEWIQNPKEISDVFDIFWEQDYQILVHVNGDKGLEELLAVIARKMKEYPREDHRTTIVHFANSNEAQIKRIAELGCIVSVNPYYVTAFSDKYAEVGLGPERANAMVRSASVEKLGIPISLHSDLPIAPADPLYLAWCATTRETLNGNHPRKDLALSLHQALRGITIDAAQSWRMEDELGSIKVGKIANFTILDKNPYTVGAKKLRDIKIWGTVFEGKIFMVKK